MLHGRACVGKACHCASSACSSARRGQSAPSLGALLSMAPAAFGENSHIQELHRLGAVGGVLPHAPLDSPRWVAVSQPAHSFSERGLLFVFSWSNFCLVCLPVFAYSRTFGPVSSVIKVRIPPSREYWSSWHLAQLVAERSTPVLGTESRHHAWGSPMGVLVPVWAGATGLLVHHSPLCFLCVPQGWGAITCGSLLQG